MPESIATRLNIISPGAMRHHFSPVLPWKNALVSFCARDALTQKRIATVSGACIIRNVKTRVHHASLILSCLATRVIPRILPAI
jgi:hypothetical protein